MGKTGGRVDLPTGVLRVELLRESEKPFLQSIGGGVA